MTPAAQNHRPRIAVSPGNLVVGWTTPSDRAFVAERVGTSWTGTSASPSGTPRLQFLQGVAPRSGTATAVILSFGSRLYATTET